MEQKRLVPSFELFQDARQAGGRDLVAGGAGEGVCVSVSQLVL